ncbi:hypothetical protein SAMN05421743_10143 [Thalassobacillus cyri]|uniref:Uncharacterized protein n=1 Tax=Thalassobacillus cyri TaxID=571932 RepID=A0A1H3VKL4_9BACI|nr:hypothetical protein [Thalassobacillus cyri]SDZ74794.1 hypothetical protein SAMN05421743_10143 [Thalassobacillus cyri]
MVYIIDACFHWIGFHLTQHLLTEGYEVIGIDPLEGTKQENLYFFIGRNSRFQHFHSIEEMERHCHNETIEAVISVGSPADGRSRFGELFVYESVEGFMNRKGNGVELPPLYGEWMPRDEQTIYISKTEPLLFSDLVDREDSLYIEDFIVYFFKNFSEKGTSFSASDLLSLQSPSTKNNEELKEQLQEHYRQYRRIYEY